MSIVITDLAITPNADVYREGASFEIRVRLKNQSAKTDRAILEAAIRNQSDTHAPVSVRHGKVQLEATESRELMLYDETIDQRFFTDAYTVAVGLVNQFGAGSQATLTFKVQTSQVL
ncbi:MAG: hypothetical protein HZC40_17200 [Chloroflexi bacterium]|nr:hypothetical protein [Chloroflexota bacterium]